MDIGLKIVVILYALMLAFIFLVLATIVDEVNKLSRKIESLKKANDDALRDIHAILIGKAEKEDIEREAAANLNIRNDIGKLGNRIRKIEKEINK